MHHQTLAVVTGGSSGIGLELARELGSHGHDLLIVSENPAELDQAAQQLRRGGAEVDTLTADLATEDGVERLVDRLRGRDVDVLCVNAGIGRGGAFTDTDLATELKMIDLNCRGAVQLVKPVVKRMVARGEGRILFTSSIAATMPDPFEAVYGATKVFLRWFAQGLREELRGTGVTVTALMPSTTETNFFKRARMMNTRAGTMKKDDPAIVAKAGIAALMADEDHVIPTMKNKAMGFIADHLPDTTGAHLHRGLSEPGTDRKSGGVGLAPIALGAAVGIGAVWLASRSSRQADGGATVTNRDGARDADLVVASYGEPMTPAI